MKTNKPTWHFPTHHVEVEDWPTFIDVWVSLQVFILNSAHGSHFFNSLEWLTSKIADQMFKLKIDKYLALFGVSLLVLSWMVEPWLWYFVMAVIQDGQQDGWHHVKMEDWHKLIGVQFLLQVTILNAIVIVAIFVMAAIQDVQVEDWPKFTGICLLQVSPYVA